MARCTNGGCTRDAYQGSECFKCWAGTKWDGMKQRVEDRHGRYPQWRGKSLEFTRREFVAWALANPPPPDMQRPSMDRINPDLGYSFTNIRWMEQRLNSRNKRNNIPLTHRFCTKCGQAKPLTTEFFGVNRGRDLGFQTYRIPCKRGVVRDSYHRQAQRKRALVCA